MLWITRYPKAKAESPHWTPVIFRPYRWHCIKNRCDSVMEIIAWAQEHFQKSLNTVPSTKKKPHVNMVQKHHNLFWAKAYLKWVEAKGKTVLWSDKWKFEILLENMDRASSRLKRRTIRLVSSTHFKRHNIWLGYWGCINVYVIRSVNIWKGTINAESHTHRFQRFSREGLEYFS